MTDLMSGTVTRAAGADLAVDLDPSAESFRIFTISVAR